ncbi:MAG: hypothetical protein CL402_11150 [Acidiferrobacteraceae bacterium]|nr:hypothetical protein [Acidiferrobacteraceae bacterium]
MAFDWSVTARAWWRRGYDVGIRTGVLVFVFKSRGKTVITVGSNLDSASMLRPSFERLTCLLFLSM